MIDSSGQKMTVMAYTMNSPYRECPAVPSQGYLQGIVEGCRQNGIDPDTVCREAQKILRRKEIHMRKNGTKGKER